MLTLTKNPRFFKGREGAAGERFAIAPGVLYRWAGGRLPATVEHYAKSGVLEELSGDPGPGFDVVELHAEHFTATTRPDPKVEPLMSLDEMLKRLGWTVEDLRAARLMGFPSASGFAGGPSADRPDDTPRALWHWSAIARWLRETQGTVQKIAAASAAK